ncbi:uncharacterized protein LOC6579136 [Drosophila mojavensis]|uniref:Protein TsetseEP domain-containing protein n=1 Tax=Drosophila mojavensis TaxID=7230 RepID=B4KNK9_DROMO|nr:uncharacterized protein LOC6579136 [Drosophila mojavensis]EDW08968.1 uncharacterized protein Dmoj_GI20246 [Drosophila mojavensis]
MKAVFTFLLLTQLLHLEQAETSRILESLAEYLEHHDLAGAGNTKQCFARYLPQLKQVGRTWETAYADCQQHANSGRDTVFSQVGGMQQQIRQAAMRIDSYIGSCLNITNVLDYFDCFAKLSKQQLMTMYNISFNASENALAITKQLNGIDEERYLCTNRSEHNYVLETAKIFDALDKCLQDAAKVA